MSVFSLILIIAVTWSVGNIMVKKSMAKMTPWQIYAFDAVAVAFPLWMAYGIWQKGDLLAATPLAIGSAFMISLVYALYYITIYKGPLGLTSPIMASSPVITVILAFFFLHEQPEMVNIIGIILTLAGIILISLPQKWKFRLEKWVYLALLVFLGYGIFNFTGKLAVNEVGNPTYLMILALTQVLAIILWKPFTKDKFPKYNQAIVMPFLGILLLNIGNIAFYAALEKGLASIVVPLSNSYLVLLLFMSVVVLKEKISFFQLLGVFTVIAGIVLVNMPKVNQEISNSNLLPSGTPSVTFSTRQKAHVDYVFDGDTVEISKKTTVRLLGINAPETANKYDRFKEECFGEEAKSALKEWLTGKNIEIETDIEDKDQYGRLLRYIWIDNILINEYLVRSGYADIYPKTVNTKYLNLLKSALTQAKAEKRGMWGKCNN